MRWKSFPQFPLALGSMKSQCIHINDIHCRYIRWIFVVDSEKFNFRLTIRKHSLSFSHTIVAEPYHSPIVRFGMAATLNHFLFIVFHRVYVNIIPAKFTICMLSMNMHITFVDAQPFTTKIQFIYWICAHGKLEQIQRHFRMRRKIAFCQTFTSFLPRRSPCTPKLPRLLDVLLFFVFSTRSLPLCLFLNLLLRHFTLFLSFMLSNPTQNSFRMKFHINETPKTHTHAEQEQASLKCIQKSQQ